MNQCKTRYQVGTKMCPMSWSLPVGLSYSSQQQTTLALSLILHAIWGQ